MGRAADRRSTLQARSGYAHVGGDTISGTPRVLAAATIVALGSGGGNDYAEPDVQVWRYPQAERRGTVRLRIPGGPW